MALYRVDGLAIFKDISGLRKIFFFVNCLEDMTWNLQLNAIEKS